MSTPQDSDQDAADPQIQYHEDHRALEAESYTAHRLVLSVALVFL